MHGKHRQSSLVKGAAGGTELALDKAAGVNKTMDKGGMSGALSDIPP